VRRHATLLDHQGRCRKRFVGGREGDEQASLFSVHHRATRRQTAYTEIICLQQEFACRFPNNSSLNASWPKAAQTVIPNGYEPAVGLAVLACTWYCLAWGDSAAAGVSGKQSYCTSRRVPPLLPECLQPLPCQIILVREGHRASPDRSTSGVEVRPNIHVFLQAPGCEAGSPRTPAPAPAPDRSFFSHHCFAWTTANQAWAPHRTA